jgi:hypothetical protein
MITIDRLNARNMLYAIILKFGLPQAQHKPIFKLRI